ncbi:MAG: hypothetical protein AMJ78_00665 [Omnitrophica WOR_2 bacterium SM23_29]|nr:MAG: hypothetical protein AMJ78_00665 [Omnitrophica WOR_2 bacterium SM23_29]
MAFSDYVVEQAWKRADGKCECRRIVHGHIGRCNKSLSWENRGRETGWGSWEAHHISISGGDGLSNCEILCWDCHKRTF